MNKFKELQDKHLALLQRFKEQQPSKELIQDVEAYIQEVRTAGKDIASSQERDQLRANLRFWGAFIFEQKKVFPDIQLWPSIKTGSSGKWRQSRVFRLGIGILGGIVLILIMALALSRLFVPLRYQSSRDVPTLIPTGMYGATYPTGQDPLQTISALATQTAVAGGSAGMATSTPGAELTVWPTLLPVTVVSAGPTFTPVAALATATPTPTPTMALSLALPPALAGFPPSLRYSSGCEDKKREVTIVWDTSGFDEPSFGNAKAYWTRAGTSIPEATAAVQPNGTPAVISFSSDGLNQSYFLQVIGTEFLFDPIIVPFTSECAYDHLSITYRGYSKSIDRSHQVIDLALVDWGPNSIADPASWIAELSLKQDAGGIYLYNRAAIRDETIFVEGSACSSRPFTLGRASNGTYQEATFSLHLARPLCPDLHAE